MPNKFVTYDSFSAMVQGDNWVVLDTETTGLGDVAQCVDIAIVDRDGTVLLDTLVKPSIAIENAAAQAHGITDEMVKDARTWNEVQPIVYEIIKNRVVVAYGATFDRRILHQSDRGNGIAEVDYCKWSSWACAMEAFADLYCEINPRFGTKTWKKLVVAARYFELGEFGAHRALADADMTRRVSLAMSQLWTVDNSLYEV